MKTTYTIAAIAMFAVIMGMSAIAPAMADRSNGQKSIICHFEAAHIDDLGMDVPAEWVVINVNNRSLPAHLGDENGHEGHGDLVIDSEIHGSEISAEDCVLQPIP